VSAGGAGGSTTGGTGGSSTGSGGNGAGGSGGSSTAGTGGQAPAPDGSAAEVAGDAPSTPPTGTPYDFKCTPTGPVPNVGYENIVNVPDATEVAGPPGMLDTLLVIQHERGVLRAVDLKMKRLIEQPVVSFPVSTSGSREQGLLSMAFHPKFTENKLFYLFYSAGEPRGQSMVDEFELGADLKATKKRNVYSHPHPAGNHNGGSLLFGADGMMFLGMGDNQNRAAAGDRDGRYGRILRFDAATGMPPAAGNIMGWTWDYGLRNPYRMSFDLMTGDLYIGDVGDGTWEEINFAPAGKNGNDWGWTTNGDGRGSSPETEPVVRLPTRGPGGVRAIIGGHVYRGKAMPGLCGRYFYGTHSGQVFSLKIESGKATDIRPHSNLQLGGLGSFGLDANGEIYMSSFTSGVVRKLVPAQ
jgi:glucose/arabinose dehydrogenase